MKPFDTIVLIFCIGAIAPFVHRLLKGKADYLLALAPAAVFCWLWSLLPSVSENGGLKQVIEWFPHIGVNLRFYVDGLSLMMALLITGVGTFIVLYARDYLKGHPLQGRFFCYLFIFMGSMLGVVLSDDLIGLFVFWELTSISSYLLIGFYHDALDSRKKALQALLVTGGGGVAMLAGFILLGVASGSSSISEIVSSEVAVTEHALYPAILCLVLIGAFTKSAQWPFHFWLPNAMAGPAPVSAYLHSATMVKAGVFLLARLNPVLGETAAWSIALTTCGLMTMFTGAINGMLQTDIKKILAYTTLSVLGILVMLLGLGTELAIKSALMFLLGHALYKATLFMCAGAIDHETGSRDVRLLGGLRRAMPFTAFAAGFAALSKSGFPPFFGFLSKESVYETGSYLDQFSNAILVAAVLVNVVLMALAFKVGIHPFWGVDNSKTLPKHPHEAPWGMRLGPLVLAVLGLLMGLFPDAIIAPVVGPALNAVVGHPVDFEIALWHGFNKPFFLGMLTLLGGFFLYRSRYILWKRTPSISLESVSFNKLFNDGLVLFMTIAKWQTRVLQSGDLRRYLIIILGCSGLLIGYQLLSLGFWPSRFDLFEIRVIDCAVVLFILGSFTIVVTTQSRMSAIVALGGVGFGVTMIFLLYGAPDLAITQILIETLTVVLFMLAIYKLPYFQNLSSKRTKVFDAVFSTAVGSVITLLVLVAQNYKIAPTISAQYGEWGYTLAHGKNVVNVILVDFRALDTLGEISVLAIASIGVYTLIQGYIKRKKEEVK